MTPPVVWTKGKSMIPVVNTYLFFDGTCEEALSAYERILGGTITFSMKVGGSPAEAHFGPGNENRILHACLDLGGRQIQASDTPPGKRNKPQGFNVTLETDSVAEAERIFAALSEGGEIEMPFGPTFWAERFGGCKDRWGVPWMVSYTGNMRPPNAG